ncbi:succinate dehydrogenase [filamentous cyanobacterium CCP5]|nr:succinate dehydrogenase [filamentous cyanobacterium CCP5]
MAISTVSKLGAIIRSPIGKKLVTGITGLGLVLFVLVHMLGNLTLFISADAYNAYAYHLENWGPLLYGIEALLLVSVLFHAALGIEIFASRLRSRPRVYADYVSAGQKSADRPSYQSVSSRTMIITGTLLAAFLVAHLLTFKFGSYYPGEVDGHQARDLARLVIEKFQQLYFTLSYTAIMAFLGLHLRHGIWSALQSLGVLGQGVRPLVFGLGSLLALAIAAGFVALPWAIYAGFVG